MMKRQTLGILLTLVFTGIFIVCILLGYMDEAVLIISIILFVWTVIRIQNFKRMLKSACISTAVISAYRTRKNRYSFLHFRKHASASLEYAPIVKYRTDEGMEIEAEYPYYSKEKQYHEGDSVTILYMKEKPNMVVFSENQKEYFLDYRSEQIMAVGIILFSIWNIIVKNYN